MASVDQTDIAYEKQKTQCARDRLCVLDDKGVLVCRRFNCHCSDENCMVHRYQLKKRGRRRWTRS